jgi:RNA polymerase sigma-70 factor, ECF subfamily
MPVRTGLRQMIDEQSLAARLAGDLEGCFEEFVRTYQDRMYAFALRLLGSRQDAEEAAQDAFVRAYRALERYPTEQRRELHLRAWLYQIVLNVVRNRVRRHTLTLVPLDSPVGEALPASTGEQPEVVAEQMAVHSWLSAAIADLPPRYGTAVVLRHVQGLSYAEAAEVLDQPVGTTKSDVHRGLRLLRERLEPEVLLEARVN